MDSTNNGMTQKHTCDCGFETVDARGLIAHLRFGTCVPRAEHGEAIKARLRVLAVDCEATRVRLGFLENEITALETLNATMWHRTGAPAKPRLCVKCGKRTSETIKGVPQCGSHVAKVIKGNASVGVPAGDREVSRILEAFLYGEK